MLRVREFSGLGTQWEDTNEAKVSMKYQPTTGGRPRGRPKKQWMDGVC